MTTSPHSSCRSTSCVGKTAIRAMALPLPGSGNGHGLLLASPSSCSKPSPRPVKAHRNRRPASGLRTGEPPDDAHQPEDAAAKAADPHRSGRSSSHSSHGRIGSRDQHRTKLCRPDNRSDLADPDLVTDRARDPDICLGFAQPHHSYIADAVSNSGSPSFSSFLSPTLNSTAIPPPTLDSSTIAWMAIVCSRFTTSTT